MSAHEEVGHEMQARGLSRLVPFLPRLLHPFIRILVTGSAVDSWWGDLTNSSALKNAEPQAALDLWNQVLTGQLDPSPIGISKIGGCPDIWPGFQCPQLDEQALPFLAQFRLDDIASFDEEELLPTQGMLLIFFDFMAHLQYEPAVQALYFDGDLSALRRAEIPDNATRWNADIDGEIVYESPQLLRFCRDWQLADDDNLEYQSIAQNLLASGEPQLSGSENEAYWRFSLDWNKARCEASYKRELNRTLGQHEKPKHQLLGVPYAGNFDGRSEFEPMSDEPSAWRLLFQLSGDDGLNWGNCCSCSFFIERDALARRDFSNIHVTCDG